ncbi:MAG TPA: LCCL domain-containing protein [Ilumatobacteraceae bacterium]
MFNTTSSTITARRTVRLIAGLGVLAAVAAGCSSSAKLSSPKTVATVAPVATAAPTTTVAATSTTAAATTTIAAAATVPVTTPATVAATTPATEPAGSAPADTSGTSTQSVWDQTATQYRGQNGQTYTLVCTPNGTTATIWGTETYTDDSSICNAAVQVGLITYAAGGSVDYQIAAGQDTYAGMLGNGVTSESYGSWSGSFIFPKAPPGTGTFTASLASWDINGKDDAGKNGTLDTVICSAKGTIGSVWGTGTYTSDSSVCTAAVLEGLITVDKGGTVVIEIAPGADSYTGSTANGVTSQDYGAWDSSFTFPKDQTPPPTTVPTPST